jgi:hypothetical protein
LFFASLFCRYSLLPLNNVIHNRAGVGGAQIPLWAGRDLGTFRKYQLDVEGVLILGGARGMQALVCGGTHSANMAAMLPIRTALAGGDVVVVAGFLNKNLLKFIAQKSITKPGDLRGKTIGIANFRGSNEFGVLLALREWGIPRETVNIIPAGDSASRLTTMVEAKGMDATVISYDHALLAADKGLTILGDLAEIVPEFPDRTDRGAPIISWKGTRHGQAFSAGAERVDLPGQHRRTPRSRTRPCRGQSRKCRDVQKGF